MITNQMRNDPFSQIIIENGVVKVRDPGMNVSKTEKKSGDI